VTFAGDPDQYVSTSYVERKNLSLWMSQRRFTRLTNGFSKKLDNHVAAVALWLVVAVLAKFILERPPHTEKLFCHRC
jgi:hypothetical protein